jgi:hypothetical protein
VNDKWLPFDGDFLAQSRAPGGVQDAPVKGTAGILH